MVYLEEDCTINGAYYAEGLRRLRQEIVKKRRGKLTRGVLLLQDSATTHTSKSSMAAAIKCSLEVLPHPLYSPDLASSELYLFRNLKINLRGRNCGSNECDIDAFHEYLGIRKRLLFFEGINKLE